MMDESIQVASKSHLSFMYMIRNWWSVKMHADYPQRVQNGKDMMGGVCGGGVNIIEKP